MLVLKRKDGQWVEITHAKTGEKFRVSVENINRHRGRDVSLVFDDDAHNFLIQREERIPKRGAPMIWKRFV